MRCFGLGYNRPSQCIESECMPVINDTMHFIVVRKLLHSIQRRGRVEKVQGRRGCVVKGTLLCNLQGDITSS